jgi:hypothetical protein
MMVNTADSPMMKILDSFTEPVVQQKTAAPAVQPVAAGGQE